jgi:hypothetical protein
MKITTGLDRLTAFTIKEYAHTNVKRHSPEELSDETFAAHRKSVEHFLCITIADVNAGSSLGEKLYYCFSPLSTNKPFEKRDNATQSFWEHEARRFMDKVVAELRDNL